MLALSSPLRAALVTQTGFMERKKYVLFGPPEHLNPGLWALDSSMEMSLHLLSLTFLIPMQEYFVIHNMLIAESYVKDDKNHSTLHIIT